MWLEYIRYRFRLNKADDLLELTQIAALKGLRNSSRCRSWRVLPSADDPSLLILEIEWDPGAELAPFRGSEEFTAIHSALAGEVRCLEEADYRVHDGLLRRLLGGPEALFRLAEDIVSGVASEPLLAWRFQSDDGAKRGRLGLWLLEVLGGPDLFSTSFPGSDKRDGPLANDRLDLEERERLLEIALEALPEQQEEHRRSVIGNLRAHLPVHPSPPSRLDPARMLGFGSGERARNGFGSGSPGPESEVRSAPPSKDRTASIGVPSIGVPSTAMPSTAMRHSGGVDAAARASGHDGRQPSEGAPRFQTGVRARDDEAEEEGDEAAAAQIAGEPWPARPRPPSPTLRSRASGRWPRWRARPR